MRAPQRAEAVLYLRLTLLLSALFVLVYGGLNAYTARRTDVYQIYFEWELSLPLVAPLILVYLSLGPLLLLPLFYLDGSALKRLALRLGAAIVLAAGVFLILPGRLGFAREAEFGVFAPLFDIVHALDAPHNVFPSLHIALSALTLAALYPYHGRIARAGLGLWLAAMCVSVVLVHQHHVADVAGGLALAAWCQWRIGGMNVNRL